MVFGSSVSLPSAAGETLSACVRFSGICECASWCAREKLCIARAVKKRIMVFSFTSRTFTILFENETAQNSIADGETALVVF